MSKPTFLLPDELKNNRSKTTYSWGQASGCAPALLLAELQERTDGSALVIVPTVAEAEALEVQLAFFSGKSKKNILLADPETLPYDNFSPHQDLVSRRLSVLTRLLDKQSSFCIIAAPTLFYRLPPRGYIQNFSLQLESGQNLGLSELHTQLATNGYERVSQVSQHGEFAVRGSLIDLYPMGSEQPIRIDFFDNEIDSLRYFDPDSQISGKHIKQLNMLPARDFPTDQTAIREFRTRFRERFEGNPGNSPIYTEVSDARFPGGIENYLPLFFEPTRTIWDYLSEDCTVISLGNLQSELEASWQQILDRYEQCRHDTERPALSPEELFCSLTEHRKQLTMRQHIELRRHTLPERSGRTVNLAATKAPPVMINTHASLPAGELTGFLTKFTGRVLLAAESAGRREMLTEMLRDNGISTISVNNWKDFCKSIEALNIVVAPLDNGIILQKHNVCIIAEHELFGARPARRRKRKVRDPETILNDLTDLHEGSPVVHIDYGVGRYLGLSHLEIDGVIGDFLTLEYASKDRLHVPVGSLQLISRYTGTSPENAPLHKLGSDQWARVCSKAAEQIRDIAAEMLDLYATREARVGRSFHVSPADYEAFCAEFPFELTEDQATAIDATQEDLHSPQPMDRLICGDVGFGKTEVALRAAFTTALAGSQVAILAPTTLLAQQHYQTFTDRFADWPVNIEVLSRFRSASEVKKVIAELAKGSVDIIIGTHKLLQEDIHFDNLGLVIVDEEHRFGVRQKERLKTMRAEVDILTLTATPIPRTLNLALGELRELSLITTPPESRLSIKTYVTEWSDALIREACQRELKRGGQVFFVHNRIEDIETQARRIREIMPNADLQVAHGQMHEQELEQIMLDFSHRRFHILLCTAIIESGIDIPSANTIIINRADRFGLAQLHQLRGRVGRSHHKAFAYLLAPPDRVITKDARKRLDAIEAMEDLGAGFVLATHDLEIRGAGELLGEQQTGQIQQIGFSLYTELLGRAVNAIRRGETPDLETTRSSGPEVNLHLPALLPEDYLPDVQMRLIHYKRISSVTDEESLRQLQVELIDRFGLLPDATRNLFRQTRLRLGAAILGIRKIEGWPSGATVEFEAMPSVDPAVIIKLVQSEPERYAFDSRQRLRLTADLEDNETRFAAIEGLVNLLTESSNDAAALSV
ncbi:MAG: transcription-repair coupling factor [Gammaproteobacteria bacterium]|nr:transcription-repair coupling factor [Gammaproteobacteria bacterium]